MIRRELKGLALAELVVAVGIVSFALLTLMGVLTYSYSAVDSDRQLTNASAVARQVLESLKAVGGDAIPDGSIVFDGRTPDPLLGTFPPAPYPVVENSEGKFYIVVKVAPRPPSLKSVTVQVYYSPQQKVTLQTYVQ